MIDVKAKDWKRGKRLAWSLVALATPLQLLDGLNQRVSEIQGWYQSQRASHDIPLDLEAGWTSDYIIVCDIAVRPWSARADVNSCINFMPRRWCVRFGSFVCGQKYRKNYRHYFNETRWTDVGRAAEEHVTLWEWNRITLIIFSTINNSSSYSNNSFWALQATRCCMNTTHGQCGSFFVCKISNLQFFNEQI